MALVLPVHYFLVVMYLS